MVASVPRVVAIQVIATLVAACSAQVSSWAWQGRELRGGRGGGGAGRVGGGGGGAGRVGRVGGGAGGRGHYYHGGAHGSSGGGGGQSGGLFLVLAVAVGVVLFLYAVHTCAKSCKNASSGDDAWAYSQKAQSCLSAGHPLSDVNGWQMERYAGDSYRDSWICDLCDTESYNKDRTFFHCYRCDMDFCEKCWSKNRPSTSVEMGSARSPMITQAQPAVQPGFQQTVKVVQAVQATAIAQPVIDGMPPATDSRAASLAGRHGCKVEKVTQQSSPVISPADTATASTIAGLVGVGPVWNPSANCDGVLASDRVQWLVENESFSTEEAQRQVIREYPSNFIKPVKFSQIV